jgi:predicted amino acid racemase
MTTQFRTIQEIKGNNDFGQLYSDQIYNATLTASTNTQLTVPGGGVMGNITSYGDSVSRNKVMAIIRVSVAAEVWFAVNATAGVPAGASFAKATSEVIVEDIEMARLVKVGDVLNFYTTGTGKSVSVAFYAMPS